MFGVDEMVAAFDVVDVNPNPARFDHRKAESINGDHIRLLPPEEFARRLLPYLSEFVRSDRDRDLLDAAAPLVQERMQLLSEAPALLGFLFTPDDDLTWDADVQPESTDRPVLDAAYEALATVMEWRTEFIETALRNALIEGLGLKPRLAFGPLRAAISGRRISPPLFESMELLGRDSTLERIARYTTLLAEVPTP